MGMFERARERERRVGRKEKLRVGSRLWTIRDRLCSPASGATVSPTVSV